MSPAWAFALARLAVAVGVAVLLGMVYGQVAIWLTVVLGGTLAWQFANLYRVQRWLRHRSHEDPPDLGGVWGDVVALIGRIYRRKQFHKRRVLQLLREFRRLSAALPDAVVLLSPGREILWFNRRAAQLLGLRRKADLGMPIENLVRHPDFSRYLQGPAGGTGVVVHDPSPATLLRHAGHDGYETPPDWRGRFRDAYRAQMGAWAASLSGVPNDGASAWDGYRATRVTEACLEAWRTGSEVAVPPEDKPAFYA